MDSRQPETSRALARVLDDLVRVPGTRITLGADALLGLVPGVGDAAATALSGLILVDAVRSRVPLPVLARMVLNCGIDSLIGQVPLVGDLADIGFRSNRMNLRLLERSLAEPQRTEQASIGYLVAAAGLVAVGLAVMVAATGWALWLLAHLLGLV